MLEGVSHNGKCMLLCGQCHLPACCIYTREVISMAMGYGNGSEVESSICYIISLSSLWYGMECVNFPAVNICGQLSQLARIHVLTSFSHRIDLRTPAPRQGF